VSNDFQQMYPARDWWSLYLYSATKKFRISVYARADVNGGNLTSRFHLIPHSSIPSSLIPVTSRNLILSLDFRMILVRSNNAAEAE
jgi:hypothetical protein